ncbi:hypothetical protein [Pseudomonas congelans]|uniref:hypothetical protein n=1 Tax=Pseudomonas congelans TaxID=200452 RepID=UPI002028ED5F|nr:hypothetical protein [Pseudomonas congelans]
MCRDEFNKTVRPNVREFPIGKQGVGFDRLELDAWADVYIAANSVDKQTPLDRSGPSILQKPSRNGQIRRSPPEADRQSKSVEEFQRVLAMVTGKPKKRNAP